MPGALTDAVVDQARSGNAAAFTTIYHSLSPAVLGYLRAKGLEDSEAVTNDVFLAALPRLASFTGGASELRRFIFTIAHSHMVDDVRRRARQGPTEQYEAAHDSRVSESAEDEALRSLTDVQLNNVLNLLAADHKEVLLLRLIADLSVAEVAAVMGKSQGSIKQLQRRGILALRKLLNDSEGRELWNVQMTL